MKILYLLLVPFIIVSCKKDKADPQPPEIEFSGFNYLQKDVDGTDLQVEVVIHFKDKNGDIGRHESEKKDACGRDIADLYLFYELNNNGTFYPLKFKGNDTLWDANCNFTVVDDSIQLSFKRAITYIEPEGNNKAIEGDIAYRLDYESALILMKPSGRFRVYLVDRLGQKSNEIFTDELVLTP
jgi:hypothetical protein